MLYLVIHKVTLGFEGENLYLAGVIPKCAIPVVCMNNRYMGAVNNTTSISNDVYRG